MLTQITSLQNSHVKNVVKLRRRRHRDRRRLTIIEGVPEVRLALEKHVYPREAYICPAVMTEEAKATIDVLHGLARAGQTQLFEVTADVFARIAYRGESGGLLLVIPYRQCTLAELSLGKSPILVIVENAEKPGNLGAILRTADAAGAEAVIVCGDETGAGTDLHNPNVVRASLGALFTLPAVVTETSNAISWLHSQGIKIVATTPASPIPYTSVDMTGPVALVVGSEARGLSDAWLSSSDVKVSIPMRGTIDSLNLAIAASLILYEAVRQRSSD